MLEDILSRLDKPYDRDASKDFWDKWHWMPMNSFQKKVALVFSIAKGVGYVGPYR